MRLCGRIQRSGGVNKSARLTTSVKAYIQNAYNIEEKIYTSIKKIQQQRLTPVEIATLFQVEYFHEMLIKHIDLVERRLLKGEKIPHNEKIFSLFEPYTQWINKGKSHPSVELGRKLLLTTDQHGLALYYKVMDQSSDSIETIPLVGTLFRQYGEISFESMSFDKGFSSLEDRNLLELFVPEVIMPKKGRLSCLDKQRESHKKFALLRRKHNAIESDINCLEHHGLNRCPDKGLSGFKRYAGFGILAYNCHKIGNKLFEKEKLKLLKKAA
jgi:hypothetical protein